MSETLPLIECSTEGCPQTTYFPENANPRLRWITNLDLKDHDAFDENDNPIPGKTHYIRVNLCPTCIPRYLLVDETFYQETERTEQYVKALKEFQA